jgi:hypothetical protein
MALSKASEAAIALEEAFIRAVPANKKKRLSETEWTHSLKKFHVDASEIRRRYSLGFVARARTAYLLQQRLIAAEFPADAVRKVVFSLVLNSFSGNK